MKTVTLLHKLKELLKPNAQDIVSMDDNEYRRRFGNFYSAQVNHHQTDDAQELSEAEYDLRFCKFYPEAEAEGDQAAYQFQDRLHKRGVFTLNQRY